MNRVDLAFPAPGVPPSANTPTTRARLDAWRTATRWAWNTAPIDDRASVYGRPCTVEVTFPFPTARHRHPRNYLPAAWVLVDELADLVAPQGVTVVDPVLVVGIECRIRIVASDRPAPRPGCRILQPGGVALVKCQDYISSGRFWNGTYRTQAAAFALDLEQIDRFEMVGEPRPQPAGRRQVHARRNLSALFVFRAPP